MINTWSTYVKVAQAEMEFFYDHSLNLPIFPSFDFDFYQKNGYALFYSFYSIFLALNNF